MSKIPVLLLFEMVPTGDVEASCHLAGLERIEERETTLQELLKKLKPVARR